MTVDYTAAGGALLAKLCGGFDTESSAVFEKEICARLRGVTDLTIDLSRVDYISSSGLRALLYIQQVIAEQGRMRVRNPSENVGIVFGVTGFEAIVEVIREAAN